MMPIDEATHTDGKHLYRVTRRKFIFQTVKVEFWDTYCNKWRWSCVQSCNLEKL